MRYSCPLNLNILIDHHIRSEVLLVELIVHLIKRLCCETPALLCHLMCLLFKLSEHRLTVYGSLEAVKEMIDEVCLLILILRIIYKVEVKKCLITRRSNLSDKNSVCSVYKRLCRI